MIVGEIHTLLGWWGHYLGFDNLSGPWYGFWSGFGSDLSELALLGAGIGFYKSKNCTQAHCHRLGFHMVDGTDGHYRTCHKHSTIAVHNRLQAQHLTKHPDQHRLFNKDKTF